MGEIEFFETSLKLMNDLFESSSFCEKILSPLKDLIAFVLEKTPKVEILSRESLEEAIGKLNDQLQEAVEAEDYGLADVIQTKIDTLTSKLNNLE